MDNGPTAVPSSDKIHLGDHKNVHWALNLEEIVYFAPDTKGKNAQSILKRFRMKVRALKHNRLAGLLNIWDPDVLNRLQEKFGRIVETFSGHCDEPHTEDLNDLNKYWDELFEFYGESGKLSRF